MYDIHFGTPSRLDLRWRRAGHDLPERKLAASSHAPPTGRDGKQGMCQTIAISSGLETTDAKCATWKARRIRGPSPAGCVQARAQHPAVKSRELPPALQVAAREEGAFNVFGAAIGEAEIGFRPIKLLRHPALSSVTHRCLCVAHMLEVELAAAACSNSQGQLKASNHPEGQSGGTLAAGRCDLALTRSSCLIWCQS